MVCPGYQEFREDRDLPQDKDFVEYFKHRTICDDSYAMCIDDILHVRGAAGLAERVDTNQFLGLMFEAYGS